jgi:hypothetical protein
MILPNHKKILLLPERVGGGFIKDAHFKYELPNIAYHGSFTDHIANNPDFEIGAFCRNPYTKAISLFHWRINKDGSGEKGKKGELAKEFEEWVCDRLKHEASCFERIKYTELELDFLGKFETLKEDFKRLCEWTGIKGLKFTVSSKGSYKYNPEEYFTDKVTELIKRYWGKSFEAYGYSEDYRDGFIVGQ